MFKYMDIKVIFHATRDHYIIAVIIWTMTRLKFSHSVKNLFTDVNEVNVTNTLIC